MNHSLPVVIILYKIDTQLCYWQIVNSQNLIITGRGWKILIPRTQVLNSTARQQLLQAAEGEPYALRLRELRLAKPWMDLLVNGERLIVDFQEWINKSSGRGSISIGVDREDGSEPEELVTWHLAIGPSDYATAVPQLFAWADLDLHEETYDDADYERYEGECSIWDEGDQFFTETFDDWKLGLRQHQIRPYKNVSGEVDFYRLELSLNELGKAFLAVDKFAETGVRQFTAR